MSDEIKVDKAEAEKITLFYKDKCKQLEDTLASYGKPSERGGSANDMKELVAKRNPQEND